MALRLTKTQFSWYFPIFLIIILAIGIISSLYVYQSVGASLRQSLLYRAETIALALDPDDLAALNGDDSDVDLPEYSILKDRLTRIRETNKDSRFVYIMGKKNGELYFVADSENSESEDYSPPGQIYYEESPAFEGAFSSKVSGSEGPTGDRWGTWITGVAPIINDNNDVVAAVGIDVDAEQFSEQLIAYTLLPIVATLILIMFVYFGMHTRRREQELIEIKSKFIAIASHDIRSPLTGLSWAMRSLVESPHLQTEDKKTATEISSQIQHLLVTANDILDGLSADMPNMSILKSEVRLAEIVQSSSTSMNFFAHEKEVNIIQDKIPADVSVSGDPGKLQQLFINIISNAIKYSHPQSDVHIGYNTDEKWHIVIVEDHGIGIPKEAQKKVFKGFYRAENAEKQLVHGTGLGLYLVKRIVELHDGQIVLESGENKGTKITVKLPRMSKPL